MRIALALVAASLVPLVLIACPEVQTLFTVCYKESQMFVILWTATAAMFMVGFIFHLLICSLMRVASAGGGRGGW